jgi:hypothetical protein
MIHLLVLGTVIVTASVVAVVTMVFVVTNLQIAVQWNSTSDIYIM